MNFMKILTIITVLGFATLTLSVEAESKWYSGGTLHKATVGEWKKSTYRNKLATAADWAILRSKIKVKVQRSGTIDTLKPYARELVQCVNKAVAGEGYDGQEVAELGAACMLLMGW